MTIDNESKYLIEMTQKNVDEAIKRFERSYNLVLENDKSTNKKLDLILAQQAEYAKDIAINKNDIERNKKDINCLGKNYEGLDKELEQTINKLGNIPLKVAAVIITLVTILGIINKFVPGVVGVQ